MIFYYLYNGHVDVVQLAHNSGATTWKHDYDAFGNELVIAEQNIALDNNLFRYSVEYNVTVNIFCCAKMAQ